MAKKYLNKLAICAFAVGILLSSQSLAQVDGPQNQEVKWLTVNALHHWFSNGGAEIEYGRRGRSGFLTVDQLDGLNWPGEYINNKGVNVGKSLWIGTTNFQDPVTGITYPYKVVSDGRLNMNLGIDVFADEFKLIGQYDHPQVFVDDAIATDRDNDDIVDDLDPSLSSDRMILNEFHTSIGISVKRKVLAFTQQNHNNYHIYEYVFKNTGIIDATGEKKLDKTLTEVVFHFQHRYGFAGEAYLGGWSPTGAAWGLNTINDAIGQDAAHPGEFRAVWSYYGPVSTAPSLADDIGLPRHTDGTILAGTNFAGIVVLHVDKSPQDQSNDMTQPSTTRFMPSDRGAQGVDQYDANLMTRKYVEFMTAGHLAQTQAEQIGKDAAGLPTAFANTWGGDAGGYAAAQGFGPYNLNIGDSIRIVVAEAVAGIMSDRDLVREIAQKWYNNDGPFILPDGSETTDRNEYKNRWVFSGKDSLFQSFRRAMANYNSGYNIPKPPPPPTSFNVASGGNKITLTWANNAEGHPNFDGYQIYRAEGRPDTTYTLIFSCNRNNVVNSFDDRTAKRGFNYYYYIQSKDNGSTNDAYPGIPLVSSKYLTVTNSEAFLTRPPGITNFNTENFSFTGDGTITDFLLPNPVREDRGIEVYLNGQLQVSSISYTIIDSTILHFNFNPSGNIEVKMNTFNINDRSYKLSEIRIVPNPFNIASRNIQFGTNTPDRLAFYNLPPSCKIKIYTESGDLIHTIDHTNGSGDELWHSVTSSQQIVVSGLYIAFFEVTEDYYDEVTGQLVYKKGDNTIKKFIIIR